MIGPERGRYREKVAQARARRAWRRSRPASLGLGRRRSPDDFDALTAVALMGQATEHDRDRYGRRPDAEPASRRDGASRRCRPRRSAKAASRWASGRRITGSITDMLGLPYDKPAGSMRNYLEVLEHGAGGSRRGRCRERALPDPQPARRHRHHADAVLLAALAPVMLKIAGEMTDGTILWMADDRNIGDHIVPSITKAAADAGRPAPRIVAGVPVTLCRNDEVDGVAGVGQQALGHCRVLAQLPAAARARRCDGCRRLPSPPVTRRHVLASLTQLPRRRRHRLLRPGAAVRQDRATRGSSPRPHDERSSHHVCR